MSTPVVALLFVTAAGGLLAIGFRKIPLLLGLIAIGLMGEWLKWW